MHRDVQKSAHEAIFRSTMQIVSRQLMLIYTQTADLYAARSCVDVSYLEYYNLSALL